MGKCFFVDYDDTLLNSTELTKTKLDLEKVKVNNELNEASYNFLEKMRDQGEVYIVTNGTKSWFDKSCSKILPSVYNLVIYNCVNFVSSSDLYSDKYANYMHWKYYAFCDILGNKKYERVVSIGDSENEQVACNLIGRYTDHETLSIKLIENPTSEEMINQIKHLIKYFDYFITNKTKEIVIER